MVRVVITFVFALLVSATAWAGNWNQPKVKIPNIFDGSVPFPVFQFLAAAEPITDVTEIIKANTNVIATLTISKHLIF